MQKYIITDDADSKISRFNKLGRHYNLVAEAIYKYRETCGDLFGPEYQSYITAGLIVFDMQRMMGKGMNEKYDTSAGGFASNLSAKLQEIKPYIKHLLDNKNIVNVDIDAEKNNITESYDRLAAKGKDCLHSKDKEYHVGATKILHFLNPYLFIIMDKNAAAAFKKTDSKLLKTKYSGKMYIKRLQHAKDDILKFGVEKFCALEQDTPITRIYDKLTFATASGW